MESLVLDCLACRSLSPYRCRLTASASLGFVLMGYNNPCFYFVFAIQPYPPLALTPEGGQQHGDGKERRQRHPVRVRADHHDSRHGERA